MKTTAHAASRPAPQQHERQAVESPPRLRRGRPGGLKTAQDRAQQKKGAYKRIDLYLGLEAAIALRRLMRDGRSAREVVEALLRDETQRREAQGSALARRLP